MCDKEKKQHNGDRRRSGMAMVEFALVFPIQLFFILAILELSLLQVGRIMVSYAASCAARAELLGQDPVEAAAIALAPISDDFYTTYCYMSEPDAEPPTYSTFGYDEFPGWGRADNLVAARNRVAVFRLVDWDSNVMNRVTVINDETEEFHTNSMQQHNICVEVRYLYRLRVPLTILRFFWSGEGADPEDFEEMHDRHFVIWDGEPHIVLRERWVIPNKGRAIDSTLPEKQIDTMTGPRRNLLQER